MAKTSTPGVELEPIDRLEGKLKLLVSVVERLKTEQTRAAEENQRLKGEVESLRARVAAGETLST
jgi:regulator of replication initiation timing